MCPASSREDRASKVSMSLGGNLAKSALTSASLHWSPLRSTPSLWSQHTVCGEDNSSVELLALMDVLLESGKCERDSVVGVRVRSVVRIIKGLAADMLAIPRIEQRRSAIGFQVRGWMAGWYEQRGVPLQLVRLQTISRRSAENVPFSDSSRETLRLRIDLIAAGYFPSPSIVKSLPRHFYSRISGRDSHKMMRFGALEAKIEAIAMLERASLP